MSIQENINHIQNEIERISNDSSPIVVAVSKRKSVQDIQKAYDLGVRDFGENLVQELVSKISVLPKDIRWHMIGHLQTNKVKDIIDKVHMIQSVDSKKLYREIEKQALKKNISEMKCLVQVNISGEDSKYGLKPDEVESFLKGCSVTSPVKVSGLMAIATNTEDSQKVREDFKAMKGLFENCQGFLDKNEFKYLSLGMSGDYKIALEEGSNMIRVGSVIFGAREY